MLCGASPFQGDNAAAVAYMRAANLAHGVIDALRSANVLEFGSEAEWTAHLGALGVTDVALAVHGDHQVSNALCAAAVALECGASLEQVAAALAAAGPVSKHRMQVATRDDGVTVINDAYNANPDSMRAGLKALAAIAGNHRSWAVLGKGVRTIFRHLTRDGQATS